MKFSWKISISMLVISMLEMCIRDSGWNAANHTNLNYKHLVVTGIGGTLERINGYLEKAKSCLLYTSRCV